MDDIPPLMAKMLDPCLDAAGRALSGAIYHNLSGWIECGNATHNGSEVDGDVKVEHVVSVVVAICFGIMGLIGLFGNSLVVLGECAVVVLFFPLLFLDINLITHKEWCDVVAG